MNNRHLARPVVRTLRAITRPPATATVVHLLFTIAIRVITDGLTRR
ncbi:hypothetical protein [Kitasatospora fiedleri]|nr:hypothetical protein [Kitasatospora fiedleri]